MIDLLCSTEIYLLHAPPIQLQLTPPLFAEEDSPTGSPQAQGVEETEPGQQPWIGKLGHHQPVSIGWAVGVVSHF